MDTNIRIESSYESIDTFPVGTTSVFSEEHIELLKSKARRIWLPEGQELFQEGSRADRLYMIYSGCVKVYKKVKGDNAMTLSMQFPGDLFGEFDPTESTILSYGAKVEEESEMGEIMQKDINELLQQNGAFALEFTAWMGTIQRISQSKLHDYLLHGKSGALCALLLRLSNTYAGEWQGYPMINKWITNTEMAGMISTTRESVNRLLGELRALKVISVEQGRIILKDVQYLRNCCHCDGCPQAICRL